jgi:hypothetical protein
MILQNPRTNLICPNPHTLRRPLGSLFTEHRIDPLASGDGAKDSRVDLLRSGLALSWISFPMTAIFTKWRALGQAPGRR